MARRVAAKPDELVRALESLDPAAALSVRLDGIEHMSREVIEIGALHRLSAPAPIQLARLGELLGLLDARPELAAKLSQTLGSVLRETSSVSLFAEAGIPSDRGLVAETIERIALLALPRPPDDQDLDRLVSRVFRTRRDCAWIVDAPSEIFERLAVHLGDIWGPVRDGLLDAAALLCTRVSALGLSAPLRERTASTIVRDSPFFRLPHTKLEDLLRVIRECREQLDAIRAALDTAGVSVDVVFRLDSIERMLRRLSRIPPLLDEGQSPTERALNVQNLFAALTSGRIADQNLRTLGRDNFALLARKVTDRIGRTDDEPIVPATRREYGRTLASAAGGGAVAALTVVGRLFVRWGHLAPMVDGLATGCVYAASFLLMQFLGLTLAMKQPSMTASALAQALRGGRGKSSRESTVQLVARISRSQFAAAVGNMVAITAVAILLDLGYRQLAGHHILDPETSAATMTSVDPISGGTLVYAAITGVLIWIAAMYAGWLENWVMYRRLPEAIRLNRSGTRLFGRRSLGWIANLLEKHTAGIGGSVALGFLLAMTPVIGKVWGLPIDVRHLTLSTGRLVLAACTLGPGAITVSACIGLVLVGLLNFSVSFALALWIAIRARGVTKREQVGLVAAVFRRFVRHPLEFFFPRKASIVEPPIPLAQLE